MRGLGDFSMVPLAAQCSIDEVTQRSKWAVVVLCRPEWRPTLIDPSYVFSIPVS